MPAFLQPANRAKAAESPIPGLKFLILLLDSALQRPSAHDHVTNLRRTVAVQEGACLAGFP
jgi:hypothetical protein